MATYDELVSRFSDAAEPALRERVAKALVDKGNIQGQLKQNEAAMATYDEVIHRFGDAAEPALREQVNRATVNKDAIRAQLKL